MSRSSALQTVMFIGAAAAFIWQRQGCRRGVQAAWSSTITAPAARWVRPQYSLRHSATTARTWLRVQCNGARLPSKSTEYGDSMMLFSTNSKDGGGTDDDRLQLDALTRDALPVANFGGLQYYNTTGNSLFRTIFVLGGPGAGKGTQCELMATHYPTCHLSVGQLLRDEQQNDDSPHQRVIQDALVGGQIVPVEISLQLLKSRMQHEAQANGPSTLFLVDGFPRNANNLQGWCDQMKGVASLWAVLDYNCPANVLQERILERAKSSGRSDDNVDSIQKRFATFERETRPVLDALRHVAQNNAPWQVVDIAAHRPLEDVWRTSQHILNQLILHDVLTANAALLDSVTHQDVHAYQNLCADAWFANSDPAQVMQTQEGVFVSTAAAATADGASQTVVVPPLSTLVTGAEMDFISGHHVTVSYERILDDQQLVRETRVWHDQGVRGWRNVHFARIPMAPPPSTTKTR